MGSRQVRARAILAAAATAAVAWVAGTVIAPRADAASPFIPRLVNSSTIPANGDQNPYGVAFVPEGFPSGGLIHAGDVLVSNFNNVGSPPTGNLQGTGTTIIVLTPSGTLAPPGSATTFFTSSQPGLSTALGVLRGGFVIVGNVPTTDGSFATIGQGSLQVIDRFGTLKQTLMDKTVLDGPWDLALDDDGDLVHVFVSNVLNGTVSRLDFEVGASKVTLKHSLTIATGYSHRSDPAALVLGPTGLAFDDKSGTLYVASTEDNAIYAVANASTATKAVDRGTLVFADPHLRGPLALRLAPNGDLLAANGDAINADPLHPSEIVEFTKDDQFVGEYNVDASQGGAFGLDVFIDSDGQLNFAVVDDVTNNLSVSRRPD
jgi:hypothetical protein